MYILISHSTEFNNNFTTNCQGIFGLFCILYNESAYNDIFIDLDYIHLFTFFIIVFLSLFMRIHAERTSQKFKRENIKISDFAFLVSNIPKNATKDEIIDFFECNSLPNKKVKINDVCLIYDFKNCYQSVLESAPLDENQKKLTKSVFFFIF